MKAIWNRRWFRNLVYFGSVPLVWILAEATRSALLYYQIKNEVPVFMAFKERFKPDRVDMTCPKEKFTTQYQCMREVGQPLFSQANDTTENILLISFGVLEIMKDKQAKRCAPWDCAATLQEFCLDMFEKALKEPLPSRYSPWVADHVVREVHAKFFASMVPNIDKSFQSSRKQVERMPASESKTQARLRMNIARYDRLRPLMQEQGKDDFFAGAWIRFWSAPGTQ
jgi:hypothetical protein